MMKEEWRDVKGYEGKYQVSNLGRVKSLNYRHTGKEQFLKPGKNGNGYLFVNLYKNGVVKHFRVHRLVGSAFIPNPDNFSEINHKDEVKTNNSVSNLEWCSRQYNNTYAEKHRRHCKKIAGYKDNKLVKIYDAVIDVDKDGFHHQNVREVLKGKRKSSGGFQWKYL